MVVEVLSDVRHMLCSPRRDCFGRWEMSGAS